MSQSLAKKWGKTGAGWGVTAQEPPVIKTVGVQNKWRGAPGEGKRHTPQDPLLFVLWVQACTGLHQDTGPILRVKCQEATDQTPRDVWGSPSPVWGHVCTAGVLTSPHNFASGESSIPRFAGTRMPADVREVHTARDGGEEEIPKRQPTQCKILRQTCKSPAHRNFPLAKIEQLWFIDFSLCSASVQVA